MNNYEGVYILFGIVIATIVLFLLYSGAKMTISQGKINKAIEICNNNDGLRHIEWKSIDDKVVCNNGGVFKVKGR